MRLLAALLVLSFLAGCTQTVTPPAQGTRLPELGVLAVPEGAVVQALATGKALAWPDATLPFTAKVTLPANATMVRLVVDPAQGSVGVGMANDATGRRRCNNPTVQDFNHGIVGRKTCSYVALIDPPGSVWRVAASGSGKAAVHVEFLTTPLDGLPSMLDLSQLSMPTYALKPTTTQFVPSFDGTQLRVEVTLPDGPGPWPTILESSPYHDDGVRNAPASFAYFVHDWAMRGYAVVTADVRGFGDSGGCVEVWGPNEQKDQAFLVEWAAKQSWSDGNVGFYGQSYVGTTPVEAAVLAPPHLKAIVTVAPVVRNYDDWHFGGVPNGENLWSPYGYAVEQDAMVAALLGEQVPPLRTEDPVLLANNVGNGICDPADLARPNDPRALYDAYYQERDFAALAGNVKAAVLYTHGFEDANVKAQMIPDWFNAIQAPKLGLFGHWLHQHPPRMDQEVLFLGWMDQYVKGRDLGFQKLPAADVVVNATLHRTTDAWPTAGATDLTYAMAFGDGPMTPAAQEGSADVYLDPLAQGSDADRFQGIPLYARASAPLEADVLVTGAGSVHVKGELKGAGNGYLRALVYDWDPAAKDEHLVTWGEVNLAHNADHTAYTPVQPGTLTSTDLPLRPTEYVLASGHFLVLELRGVPASSSPTSPFALEDPYAVTGATFTYMGGADGTRLHLPSLPMTALAPLPLTAQP